MHVHIVAVSGTGMGPLAGLLVELGHRVSGSDVAFEPPMGPALASWGVECQRGFEPAHLEPRPDLVVIGNVCRPDNVEARFAIDSGMNVTHLAGALGRFVLEGVSPLVVSGTHGKTTTTALTAYLLDRAGRAPGFLIGGVPADFSRSFRKPGPRRLLAPGAGTHAEPSLDVATVRRPPFVIEGDEYDTAFFEKTAKFLHYRPEVAILTSIEHDHIDIYPTLESYVTAFERFVALLPEHGLLVANAADPLVRKVAEQTRSQLAWFALEGEDTGSVAPHWLAAPAAIEATGTSFDLFAGGVACGRLGLSLPGRHNLKNALAALAAAAQGFGVRLADLGKPLAEFRGVKRRQELVGTPAGVTVYDDFAHHPSAVRETLAALRARHPRGRLLAVFEPRSATACRRLHQHEYPPAFAAADIVLIAPLGRTNLPPEQSLDLEAIVGELLQAGKTAEAPADHAAVIERVAALARPGDVVALLSNGAFGGVVQRVVERLGVAGPVM
jgi:UDP-N-acetylmuramate: L-alanyl-gamma-D-glutamyl-meso-diaminopimelate ligase